MISDVPLPKKLLQNKILNSRKLFKVCGMRDAANIRAVLDTMTNEIKPAMMGFIFYNKSPRYVGASLPVPLIRQLRHDVRTIGVFVDASLQNIAEAAQRYSLSGVQLHGAETPDFCRRVRTQMANVRKAEPFLILKAFRIADEQDFHGIANYADDVDYVLLDAKGMRHGGNGTRFDWGLLGHYSAHVPFFLSGGVGLEHIDDLHHIAHPQFAGVDVNSRFEIAPALKDANALAEFARAMMGVSS